MQADGTAPDFGVVFPGGRERRGDRGRADGGGCKVLRRQGLLSHPQCNAGGPSESAWGMDRAPPAVALRHEACSADPELRWLLRAQEAR